MEAAFEKPSPEAHYKEIKFNLFLNVGFNIFVKIDLMTSFIMILQKAYIVASAEASLKHLKTDYLDALLIHRPSPLMHPEDVMSAAEDLKKDGKILSLGYQIFRLHIRS